MQRLLCTLLVSALAACGGVTAQPDAAVDAPDIDAPDIDAGIDAPIDAGVDAPVGRSQSIDLNSAGGRMTGSTLTLDVQLGTSVGQQTIQGPTLRIENISPIIP